MTTMKNKIAKRILALGLTALVGCQTLALTGCGSTKDQLGTSAETESSVSDTEGNTANSDTSGSANTSNTSDSATKSTKSAKSSDTDVSSLLEINDPQEKAAVEAAKKKVQALSGEPRIIATSPATAEICDRLDLDLVGVCSTTTSSIPDRYASLPTVGTAMSPDMEIVSDRKSVV